MYVVPISLKGPYVTRALPHPTSTHWRLPEERLNPVQRIMREYAGKGPYSLLYRLHEDKRRASVMIRRVNRYIYIFPRDPLGATEWGKKDTYEVSCLFFESGAFHLGKTVLHVRHTPGSAPMFEDNTC